MTAWGVLSGHAGSIDGLQATTAGTLSGASLQGVVRDSGGAVVASGTGNSLTAKLYSVCNVATYSVELTVTDSDGEPGSDMLNIFDVHLLC
ncbi:MAG: hypothetical protein L3J84_08285 [Gammaproteobacteria bacterium]|nr:hypothetical protein [Gammaproteobacteria bacterium]